MSEREKDLYRILGVSRSAGEKEIKSAYRKLAKKYHPDTNQNDPAALQYFQKISEAYDILGNQEKKKLYDKFGMAAFDGSMGPDPEAYDAAQKSRFTQHGPNGSYREYYYSSSGGEDWINDLFRDFRNKQSASAKDDGFQEIRPGFRRKGNDVYVTEYIPYTTAVLGGKGYFKTLSGLVECNVPAGTQPGSKIRLKGKGLRSQFTPHVCGDEYVTVQIIVPKNLSRAERDAVLQLQKVQNFSGCA